MEKQDQKKKGQIQIFAKNIKGNASGCILEESGYTKNTASGKHIQNGCVGGVNNDVNNPRKNAILKVLEVNGPDTIEGGKNYDFVVTKFSKNKEDLTINDLNRVQWRISYDNGALIGFKDDKNGNTFIDSDKKTAIKRVHFISEYLLGVKQIKIFAFITEPNESVCSNSDFILPSGVFVWTETVGTGHTFLTIHKDNIVTLFSYGRYDDAYMISLGTMGEGVLIKYPDKFALEYMKKELYRMNCKVHQIKDVTEDKALEIFDGLWNSSTEVPDGEDTSEDVKTYGRVIDNYDLTGNNCTTKTCEVLKKAGTGIFNFGSYIGNYKLYSYQEFFTIPSSFQNFLNERMKVNTNIVESTQLMKTTFENILNITQIGGAGSSGGTSGSSGDSSGGAANSSSTEQTSSGSSPASSGGSYGSSSN